MHAYTCTHTCVYVSDREPAACKHRLQKEPQGQLAGQGCPAGSTSSPVSGPAKSVTKLCLTVTELGVRKPLLAPLLLLLHGLMSSDLMLGPHIRDRRAQGQSDSYS